MELNLRRSTHLLALDELFLPTFGNFSLVYTSCTSWIPTASAERSMALTLCGSWIFSMITVKSGCRRDNAPKILFFRCSDFMAVGFVFQWSVPKSFRVE